MADRKRAGFDPLRRFFRDKLVRAVDEVVGRYHYEQLDRLRVEVDQLREELRLDREAVAKLVADLEHHFRRDLAAAAERAAAASSAEFAQAAMPTVPTFPDLQATLEYGLKLAPPDGLALEFGVWSGTTLKVIAEARGGAGVHGFDSFEGLPEGWRTGFPAGAFSTGETPDVPGAELVIGWFSDTLPKFLAEHDGEPVAFVHVDCDLYSSTVTVLEHVGPRLLPGSVLVFDEYFNYPGWQQHEHRAWYEYVQRTGLQFSYEGYTVDHEQVVVRVTGV